MRKAIAAIALLVFMGCESGGGGSGGCSGDLLEGEPPCTEEQYSEEFFGDEGGNPQGESLAEHEFRNEQG